MASLYDKIRKKAYKDAQQNRVNRATRKAKEYNGGKYNATHKSYMRGDITSSASTRAYGYKKYGMPEQTNFTGGRNKYRYEQLQKGENPYEAKYLWTGKKSYVPGGKRADGSKYEGFTSKTRQLTDDEKKAYKATGDIDVEAYDRTHNYSLMRSYNKDAKTFDEHSNLTKDGKFLWDGMEVARNKVNNGGSKFNYLGGFLKDIIVDPLREGIRHVDRLSSAGMGAIAGGIEESANLFEAIADPNIKIKDNVNFNRSKENFLKSIEQSAKEGWGRGMGEYFDDAHERNIVKEINRIKNSSSYTEEHKKKLIEELENSRTDGIHKGFRSIVGFAGDVATPFDLGGAVVDGLKKGGKATLKSGKELLNGTSDVATAFRVDGGKTQAMLDKFAKRMENVKASKKGEAIDVLTGNKEPSKPNKVINSLNNEYERVMSKTDNIVKEVKSNPNTQNLGNFLETINKPNTRPEVVNAFEDMFEASDVPNSKTGKEIFFKKLDNLSDNETDDVLDWLAEYDPKIYNEYMGDIDNFDRLADISAPLSDGYTINSDFGDLINEPNFNTPIPTHIKNNRLNNSYNELEKYRLSQKDKAITSIVENTPENMRDFSNRFDDFVDNSMSQLSTSELTRLGELVETFTKIDDTYRRDEVISYLNDIIFGGDEVILKTAKPKDVENFATHLLDLIDYNIAKSNQSFFFKPRVPDMGTKDGIHYLTKRNGTENKFMSKTGMFAPSLSDEMFYSKMSDLSSYFGVKNKSEITKPYNELKAKIANRQELTPEEWDKFYELKKTLSEWQELYSGDEGMKYLGFEDYQKYRKDKLGIRDGYEEYVNKYRNDYSGEGVNRGDFVKNIEDARSHRNKNGKATYEKANKYETSEYEGNMAFQPKDAIEEQYLKDEMDEILRQQRIYEDLANLHDELKIPLPKSKNANIKISENQKLGEIPDVVHNTQGLRKVIENEMKMMYKEPSKYEKHKGTLKNMKKEFVSALRSYGVKDEKYFDKVKSLQNDLDLYYKELKKPSSLIKESSESGQGTPKIGMNLQLLANKITDTLNELEKMTTETLSDIGDNPFSKIGDELEEFATPLSNIKPKERRIKTQKEIDEINSVLERYNKPTPLDKVTNKQTRLPKLSELMEQGMIKDEAIKVLEGMKKGEIEVPTFDIVEKADRQGGVNTTTKTNTKELNQVLSDVKYGVSKEKQLKPGEFINQSTGEVENASDYLFSKKFKPQSDVYDVIEEVENVKPEDIIKPKTFKPNEGKKPHSSVKYGVSKERKLKAGEFVNESTGEVENVSDYLFSKKFKPQPDVYDVVEETKNVKPEDIMKPKTFNPNEGKKPRPSENPFEFKKEGVEIEKPKHTYVNPKTGEVEDLSKYVLNKNSKGDPNVYDIPDDFNPFEGDDTFETSKFKKLLDKKKTLVNKSVPDNMSMEDYIKSLETDANNNLDRTFREFDKAKVDKPISKEMQELIDYVEEEKMFIDFNDSIGKKPTTFEKFKQFFTEKNPTMPYDDNVLYDVYKRWLNSWKKGLTVYNPGFHFLNFFQNKGQNFLGLGMDAFKSQKEARELLKAVKGQPNKAKTILNKHGIAYTPEDIAKLVQDLNVIDGLGSDVRQARGIFSDLETKVDNSGIMKRLNENEEVARLHHFATKLKRGATPEEALKSVNKYLFDYSNQSKFDRFMSDFIDPFWIFHKNNARLLTTQAIENPDKVGAIQRGIRGLQDDVDEQDKAYPQYRSIQSPVGQFTDSKNKDKYNYQYDVTLFPEFEKAIPLDKDGLMTKLNPLIKLAYQQANGVGEFDNKIVDKDVAKFGEVTKDENTLDMLLTVNPFMNPLFKAFDKTSNHQDKVKEGKQTQETTDKQIMMEWLAYISGNKGNYYRDLR